MKQLKSRIAALAILWFNVSHVAAQLQPVSQTDYATFGLWEKEDKSAIVFADAANVRIAPGVESELVGKIAIGTKVKITEITARITVQNGIDAPWVKIEASSVSGYVWGGVLTRDALKLSDGKLLLWGLTSVRQEHEIIVQAFASLRVVDKGALKLKQDFELEHADNPRNGYLERYAAPLIEGTKDLIVFQTTSEACGVFASSHYLLYYGERLEFVGSGYSMGDGGILSTSREFVFPFPFNESGYESYRFKPEESHIYCIEEVGEYDDDCIWTEATKVYDYTWDGKQLVKFCPKED